MFISYFILDASTSIRYDYSVTWVTSRVLIRCIFDASLVISFTQLTSMISRLVFLATFGTRFAPTTGCRS